MTPSTATPLDTLEEVLESTLRLARQAQREIIVFAPLVEPELYNNEAFTDAIVQLVNRSRYTRFCILASDTRYFQETCGRLFNLLLRADEQCFLRKFSGDNASVQPAYLICDDHSMVRRQNSTVFRGVCYTDDRARIKQQRDDFELLWNTAATDPNLRRLSL